MHSPYTEEVIALRRAEKSIEAVGLLAARGDVSLGDAKREFDRIIHSAGLSSPWSTAENLGDGMVRLTGPLPEWASPAGYVCPAHGHVDAKTGKCPECDWIAKNIRLVERRVECPTCRTPMARALQPLRWTYCGLPLHYRQPGWWCRVPGCEQVIMDPQDEMETQEILAEHRKMAELGLDSDQVRFMRESLNKTQVAMSELFGGGESAFYKYERGTIAPSRPVMLLLRLLALHPWLWAELEAIRADRIDPLSAEEISEIREKANLNRAEAEAAFGNGADFYRYEGDTRKMSRAGELLLQALDRQPDLWGDLRGQYTRL